LKWKTRKFILIIIIIIIIITQNSSYAEKVLRKKAVSLTSNTQIELRVVCVMAVKLEKPSCQPICLSLFFDVSHEMSKWHSGGCSWKVEVSNIGVQNTTVCCACIEELVLVWQFQCVHSAAVQFQQIYKLRRSLLSVTALHSWISESVKDRHWSPDGHYMYHQFNIQQFYVLPTQCIYVFCVDLRTNSDYFTVQH